jgi:hypothetical protein
MIAGMKDYQNRPIELDAPQLEFLADMAKTYGLPDVGKAVRCLVNYAIDRADRRNEIFDEIRCTGC